MDFLTFSKKINNEKHYVLMHDTQNMPLTPLCLKVEWGLSKTRTSRHY